MSVAQKDLVIVAADQDIEFALRGILGRHQSLGISPLSFDIFVHSEHDPGCRNRGASMLSIHSNRYRHGLLVFDHEGCGDERRDRVMIQNIVEGELAQHWNGRARAVVIAPEIEAWLWSNSPHVDKALGWEGKELRATLRTRRFLLEGAVKPHAPKAAVEFALRAAKKPRSSGLYMQIAEQVSLNRCEDPSFLELRAHLTQWFGLPQPTNEL